MIVESEPQAREELARIVRGSAYAVVSTVSCAEEALEAYPETTPDVVITRLVFPSAKGRARMGGNDLIKKIRSIDKDSKVIVTFDATTSFLVMNAQREGAAGRIRRPYNYDVVVQALNSVAPAAKPASRQKARDKEKPLAVSYKQVGKWFGGREKIAVVTNLTLTAIGIRTDHKMKAGMVLDVGINLPRLKEPIRAQAQVVKVKVLVPNASFELECNLIGLAEDGKRKLDVFLVWRGVGS